MSRALVRTRKIGGSIVVRIPKEVADHEQIREGELVEVEVRKPKDNWFGAFRELKAFSRDEELDAHA